MTSRCPRRSAATRRGPSLGRCRGSGRTPGSARCPWRWRAPRWRRRRPGTAGRYLGWADQRPRSRKNSPICAPSSGPTAVTSFRAALRRDPGDRVPRFRVGERHPLQHPVQHRAAALPGHHRWHKDNHSPNGRQPVTSTRNLPGLARHSDDAADRGSARIGTRTSQSRCDPGKRVTNPKAHRQT